jgi:hypothetical protein
MNVEELMQFASFDRLQYCPSELSPDLHLAIAANKHLLVILNSDSLQVSSQWDNLSEESAFIALEFDADAGRPSFLTWIDSRVVCVGFESGLLSCLDINGEVLFLFRGSSSSARSLKLSVDKDGVRLWCLYEEGLIVSVSSTWQLSSTCI